MKVAAKAPTQLGLLAVVTTGPQSALVSALSGLVMCTPQPAVPLGKAEPSANQRDWVFEDEIARPQCHCHLVLSSLTGGESLEVNVNPDGLGLPETINRCQGHGRAGRHRRPGELPRMGGEACSSVFLKNPVSDGFSFRGVGGTEMVRLLSGGPDGIDPVNSRARGLSFSAGTISVG